VHPGVEDHQRSRTVHDPRKGDVDRACQPVRRSRVWARTRRSCAGPAQDASGYPVRTGGGQHPSEAGCFG
jgi:hypothetical protein